MEKNKIYQEILLKNKQLNHINKLLQNENSEINSIENINNGRFLISNVHKSIKVKSFIQ